MGVVVGLVVGLGVAPGLGAVQVAIDRILAVVDGHVIMRSDVRAFLDLGLVSDPDGPDQEEAVLAQLIERRVVLDQVDRFVVGEPDVALIDERLEQVRRDVADPAGLDQVLARTGLTRDDLRQILADDLRRDAYLRDRFGSVDAERRAGAIDDWVSGLLARARVIRNDR